MNTSGSNHKLRKRLKSFVTLNSKKCLPVIRLGEIVRSNLESDNLANTFFSALISSAPTQHQSIRASERRGLEDWRFSRSINSRLLAADDSVHLMYLIVSLVVIFVTS